MHPVLSERRALVAYLAAWLAAAVLPASLLATGGRALLLAFAAAAPPTLLLGAAALPLWYLCRALPLRTSGPALRVHATLGLAGGAAWLVALDLSARLVDLAAPGRAVAGDVERMWAALFALGVGLTLAVIVLFTLASSVQRVRSSERRAAAAALRAHEARLALLKAQVHPHFLFNALNAISALTVQEPRLAREACVLLADFLRGSLALGERGGVPLADEVQLARAYLEVERIRLGERLTVDVRVSPAAGAARIPPLLLQPLVENAITHGIATCAQGGTLAVEARTTPGALVVTVTNPFDPQAPPRRGRPGGVGLANVSRRLAACYEGASLSTQRDVDRFTSTLVLPLGGQADDGDGPRRAQP